MTRNYTDELARWTAKRQGKPRERNLVTFHGLQDDVQAALDAGYSSKTIWAHMREQGRVGFSYETFLVYVNRLIKTARGARPGALSGVVDVEPPSQPSRRQAVAASPAPLPPPTPPTTPVSSTPTRRTGMPTFTFNPIPNPEDLR